MILGSFAAIYLLEIDEVLRDGEFELDLSSTTIKWKKTIDSFSGEYL